MMRAIWSEAPPAPAGTMTSTGLVGSQAARAGAEARSTAVESRTARRRSVSNRTSRRSGRDVGISGTDTERCGHREGNGEPLERGGHALVGVRDARGAQPELHSAEGAEEHQVVEVAEVADPEH